MTIVCIGGMHRSGTSMVSKMLSVAGLYLGHASDLLPASGENEDGFWENGKFVRLNDELLNELGAGWDFPPVLPDSWNGQTFARLKAKVDTILQEFSSRPLWGWKDPRNSITLPFWMNLLPGTKVVVCIRNPLEVAVSLRRRNYLSFVHSLELWRIYNESILAATTSENRIITHYDAYFCNPELALRRILSFLNMRTSDEVLQRSCSAASPRLRHNSFTAQNLLDASVSPELLDLYMAMCTEADWMDESTTHHKQPECIQGQALGKTQQETGQKRRLRIDILDKEVRTVEAGLANELKAAKERLVSEVAWRDATIRELKTALEERTAWARRAAAEVIERETQLREFQGQFQAIQQERDRFREGFRAVVDRIDALEGTLEAVLRGDKDAFKKIEYRRLLRRIGEVIGENLPLGATVLVVSKGDDQLTRLEGRQGWHFPQNRDGNYPGFTPADSGSAIVQLEALRSKGAQYLLLPCTAFWWLDHYAGLKSHLERHYRLLLRQEDACMVYSLGEPPAQEAQARCGLEAVIAEHVKRFESEPAILDWATGHKLGELLPAQVVFSPPNETVDELPYFDHTVDIVAVAHPNPARTAEARRVASAAVVTWLPESTGGRPALPRVEWLKEPEAPPLPTASIVIPSYNGIALTEACLKALAETLPRDFSGEIIVVDDCSTDDTEARLSRLADGHPSLKVLRNPENCGFLVTCNNGAAAATGDIVILLNNDTLPQHGWLQPLLRIFRDRSDAGAVGGKLVYPDGRLQEAGGIVFADASAANFGKGDYELDAPLYNYVREVDYVTGALIATPRKLFNELGGLDTRYRPIYYEETDYCFRLREKGYKVYYQPESVVIHLEGVTCGTDPGSGQKRHQVVNREKFRERWQQALQFQPPPPGMFDSTTWHELAVRGAPKQGGE